MRLVRGQGPGKVQLYALAAFLALAGLALSPRLKLNKNLWTVSFTLLTSGTGLAIWVALRALWPWIGANPVAGWTVSLGQAALTMYVAHHVLLAVVVRTLPSGERIWEVTFRAFAETGLIPAWASMVYVLIAAAISCAMLPVLKRRGWVMRV